MIFRQEVDGACIAQQALPSVAIKYNRARNGKVHNLKTIDGSGSVPYVAPALAPPLKWAGGKRWFVAKHLGLVPKTFNQYIEPFVGSGALFFALRPRNALISDANEELINLYLQLRDHPSELRRILRDYHKSHSVEFYYKIRSQRPRTDLRRAARMLYLNRTCWNGLYRVNRNGQFNVPIGTKSAVVLESDDFRGLSAALTNVDIRHGDFQVPIDQASDGDFLFVDPPYTVAHNNNGFVSYNEKLFSWGDQERLRDAVGRAAGRGVKVLVTNAAHPSIYSLYKDFEQVTLSRAGVIAGDGKARGKFDEVIIKCY